MLLGLIQPRSPERKGSVGSAAIHICWAWLMPGVSPRPAGSRGNTKKPTPSVSGHGAPPVAVGQGSERAGELRDAVSAGRVRWGLRTLRAPTGSPTTSPSQGTRLSLLAVSSDRGLGFSLQGSGETEVAVRAAKVFEGMQTHFCVLRI